MSTDNFENRCETKLNRISNSLSPETNVRITLNEVNFFNTVKIHFNSDKIHLDVKDESKFAGEAIDGAVNKLKKLLGKQNMNYSSQRKHISKRDKYPLEDAETIEREAAEADKNYEDMKESKKQERLNEKYEKLQLAEEKRASQKFSEQYENEQTINIEKKDIIDEYVKRYEEKEGEPTKQQDKSDSHEDAHYNVHHYLEKDVDY
jgi:ribosome-associated translation inhibitor RaiA